MPAPPSAAPQAPPDQPMSTPLCPTTGRRAAALVAVMVAALFGLALSGCRDQTPAITSRFSAFGTQVDLSLVGVNPRAAEQVAAAIKSDFGLMTQAWHPWEPGPMGRVNLLLTKGEPFVAPPSVLPLVRLSQTYWEQSGGLFNPAIGNLLDLWGFHSDIVECRPPPSERSIARLVQANPQMSDVRVEGLELQGSNPAVRLDFGDLVKGYAIDLAIDLLRERGVRDAMVQIGNDVRAIGERSGQPWRVPVRRPSGSGVLGILMVRGDESIATASAADRNFIYGGVTYHNLLDPRTGWPSTDTLAVTVAHREAATAAAAAAALFVAGPDHWLEVARSMGIRYVLLVDSRGTLHMNPEMRDRIELMDGAGDSVISPPLSPPAADSAPAPAGGAGDP